MKTSLVILAAGIGSRFGGGVKQIAPVGPNGEIIIDYSIHDALEVGFDKVVFVIRRDIEKDFREVVGNKTEKLCEVEYVFQDKTDLPYTPVCAADRRKPWGTTHALYSCRNVVKEPFLIINADDYGMCNAANTAVAELFEGGYLKSATIMMPCPTAADAVEFSKAHPEHAIGIHLTMTSEWGKYRWKPLTNGKSLIDEEGYMWHESDQVEKNASYEDLEREARAQIDQAHAWGMKPSHVDNHMGSLYGIESGRFELLNLTLDIAGEEGLPFRFPGTFVPEMFSNATLDVKIDTNLIFAFFKREFRR